MDSIESDTLRPGAISEHSTPGPSKNDTNISTVEVQIELDEKIVRGWRLHVLVFALCLTLLLSTLETTIVSTSLVSITDAVHGFDDRDWVVTSYLLTYTSFLIIYAKFSDVFRPKTTIISAVLIFTGFSAACGASTQITELIIFRAFQGLGGSGIYAMVMVIATKYITREEGAKYMAIISSVMALASLLGPLLGGAINDNGQWEWVFLLNIPAGVLSIILLAITIPSDTKGSMREVLRLLRQKVSPSNLARLDILGAFLLLAVSVLIVFALEEGGTRYAWTSAAVVSPLVLSAVLLVGFVGWEILLEQRSGKQEAIFPMRLMKNRVLVGMLLNAFFVGFPFVAVIVNVPQRYQVVNNTSPLQAGIYMLPMLLLSPLASGLSGLFIAKLRVPPFHILLVAAAIQLIGVGLMTTLPNEPGNVPGVQYAYEAIMGIGFGLGLSTLLILANIIIPEKDRAVVMGALTQVRVLAGTVGLAICATVLNNHVQEALSTNLAPAELAQISDSLANAGRLSGEQQVLVRKTFAEGYRKQMLLLTGLSGGVVLVTFLVWDKSTRRRLSKEEVKSGHTLADDDAKG